MCATSLASISFGKPSRRTFPVSQASISRVRAGSLVTDSHEMFQQQRLTVSDTISVAERQSQLRQVIDRHIVPQRLGSHADCYCDGPPKYHKTLSTETTCTQRLFVIPVARIRQYRDRLRPYFPPEHAPTMFNVLAALVWTHITRARGDRLLQHGLKETSLGITTDLRKRQSPRVPVDYMGNMALFSKGTFNVSDMLSEDR